MIRQMKFILSSITFQLIELNAFSASIKGAASVSPFEKISPIACMVASTATS